MSGLRRKKGTGSLRLRGNAWWMTYYLAGRRVSASTETAVRSEAEAILDEACRQSEQLPAVLAKSALPVQRTAIGVVSELLVCTDLTMRGYEVFRPLSQHASCDLLALDGNRAWRVEVKTGYRQSGCSSVRGRQVGQHDVLAIVIRNKRIVYKPNLPSIIPDSLPDIRAIRRLPDVTVSGGE
jgi:hypothetical protein